MGVFGAWRGQHYAKLFVKQPEIELLAVCDKRRKKLDEIKSFSDCALFEDFDSFLEYGKANGMTAVFLANYFYQHAPYAIKCMEAGMDVISECTAAGTLRECVELCEAVERTGRKYMLAENYQYAPSNLKMNQIVKSGALGTCMYAEGEYNHSGSRKECLDLAPTGQYHWRLWMPRTYYCTHALGPIMFATDSEPLYVSARTAKSDLCFNTMGDCRQNYDGTAILFCEMSNGMIARFTGCTAMASDYTRYRIVGDVASVEVGENIGSERARLFWLSHTKPEDEENKIKIVPAPLSEYGEDGEKAKDAGHAGGDYWVTRHIVDYLLNDADPFFDVYRSVAMSAAAILGWRSCLNHGENFRIPNFRDPADRESVRNDELTPFPDENGNGVTLPISLPRE